jgi:hypothetical protein
MHPASQLPGSEIVDPGLRDLRAGVLSEEALAVLAAAPPLPRAGVSIEEDERARCVARAVCAPSRARGRAGARSTSRDDATRRQLHVCPCAATRTLTRSIELASPADLLLELPGWRDRSLYLFRAGTLDVSHYDLYSQVLAKLERGLAQDVADVEAMVSSGEVQPTQLLALYEAIEDQLFRFPAVEPRELRAAVETRTA